MPIELYEDETNRFTVFHITGKLVDSDYEHLARDFERLASHHPKVRVLLDMTGFEGWDTGALWEEIKFDAHHLGEIDRLAAIGEKEWEQGLMLFSKPFTHATVRYFDRNDATAARAWLQE